MMAGSIHSFLASTRTEGMPAYDETAGTLTTTAVGDKLLMLWLLLERRLRIVRVPLVSLQATAMNIFRSCNKTYLPKLPVKV